ncbi:MAG: hypothetical protein QM831_34005 [Kofleriaceae bacterium]
MKLALAVVLTGCVDAKPPVIAGVTPGDNVIMKGIGTMDVEVDVRSDSPTVTGRLGLPGMASDPVTCQSDEICKLVWTGIDTTQVPSGAQTLEIHLRDESGNILDAEQAITFANAITVTKMEVTRESDDNAQLEMELYAFDDTNVQTGCAGSKQGLGPVDYSNIEYPLSATLIDEQGDTLTPDAFGDRPFHFEAWEDDDDPVCPSILNPSGNNFIAATPAYTADQWASVTAPISFGNVTVLQLSVGRPLAYTIKATQP